MIQNPNHNSTTMNNIQNNKVHPHDSMASPPQAILNIKTIVDTPPPPQQLIFIVAKSMPTLNNIYSDKAT